MDEKRIYHISLMGFPFKKATDGVHLYYLSFKCLFFTAEVSAQEEKVGSRRSSKGCLQYRSEVEHLLLAPLAKQFESVMFEK